MLNKAAIDIDMNSRLFVFALIIAAVATVPATAAPYHPDDIARLDACLTKAQTKADEAYEDGLQWRLRGGGLLAEQCVAIALVEKGEYENGARRLLAIANASDGGDLNIKLSLLAKATNAFLMAELPEDAKGAIDTALALKPNDSDLLFDRARVEAMLEKWPEAEADLTQAMIGKEPLPLALRLRAEARMQQAKYDLAEQDVNQALLLEPHEADNYFMRGRVRVARRLGHAPE